MTANIYRYIRHPQYLGIFLFTLGWFLRWPTIINLALWPILVAAYLQLALREETLLEKRYKEYPAYAAQTPRFFPRLRLNWRVGRTR